ncbi:MAG: hypothetical protein KF847_13645 [Pirellulales bacterium]|nr:hypothetical protein [Pirellulales bacterium]
MGFIPGLGAIPDLLNAGVSAARGDWGAAATNAFAALPGIGDGAKAGKMAAKAAAHGDEAAQAVKGALGALGQGADDAAGAAFAGTRKAGASVAPQQIEKHHSDPKFLGGDPKQKLTSLPKDTHTDLHRDLNKHLRDKTDAAGNHMRPLRGNSGRDIRRNFSREERLAAEAEFYKKFRDKYPDATRDFFEQHPGLE